MVVLAMLAGRGIDIPILRQAAGFIYLTIIPGILILRVLQLQKLNIAERLVYSTSLSITFIMLLGLFVNSFYPHVGIQQPISLYPLLITTTLVVLVLCTVIYLRERHSINRQPDTGFQSWREALSPPALFLLILPLLTALGAYIGMNQYRNNVLLLLVLSLIALTAILIVFNKFIHEKLYPLAIISIAISLLWHTSLISRYIWGWDIFTEYYFQNMVLTDGRWDSSLISSVNSMLSVVMLSPIYSLFCDMSPAYIYKVINPVLYSMIPLALFLIFRKQTDDKVAFYAGFFFMVTSSFFTEIPQLPRQAFAEIFFTVFVLLLIDNIIPPAKRNLLLILSGFSFVVSHYGLSYIIMFYLIISFVIIYITRKPVIKNYWNRLTARLIRDKSTTNQSAAPSIIEERTSLTIVLISLVVIFGLGWYMYMGSATLFNTIVNIGAEIYRNVSEIFFLDEFAKMREPGVLMALGLARPEFTTFSRNTYLAIQYIIELFVVAGVIELVINFYRTRFKLAYSAMVLVSSILLFSSIIVPYFSGYLNISRIYHIAILFLSPFCVLGGIAIIRWIRILVSRGRLRGAINSVPLKIVVILVLVPYFMFSSAFIYLLMGEPVTSIALNPDLDYTRFNQKEILAKDWLYSYSDKQIPILGDYVSSQLIQELKGFQESYMIFGEMDWTPDSSYIYLRSLNVIQDKIQSKMRITPYIDFHTSRLATVVLPPKNKIYTNGGSEVYR